jgi:hypothetical protein
VARGAINVEPFLPAQQIGSRDRKREDIGVLIADFARVPYRVDAKMAPRNRSFHGRPRRAPVPEEVRARQRLVPRLVMHILPATCERKHGNDEAP